MSSTKPVQSSNTNVMLVDYVDMLQMTLEDYQQEMFFENFCLAGFMLSAYLANLLDKGDRFGTMLSQDLFGNLLSDLMKSVHISA